MNKVKVIPLGGLDEVGKNMTAIEYKEEIFVIDVGISFPSASMHGVDVVIPNFEYLRKNKEKVKNLIITHGHEDHIGAISYFLKEFNVNVYATKLTTALIRNKLRFQKNSLKNLKIVDKDTVLTTKYSEISFFETNHSIPDSVGVIINTPLGNIVHTSDFKVDYTPIDGKILDFERISQISKKGVFLLLSDSTNSIKTGFSPSEKVVGDNLETKIKSCEKRVIVTTFASSLYRVQSFINIAEKTNRKLVPIGRSMKNNIKTALKLGYLKTNRDCIINENQIENYQDEELLILTTGSQGEPTSALKRMVEDKYTYFKLKDTDVVFFSSHSIPGNEKSVNYLINELCKKGIRVETGEGIHASGHGYQEEVKLILSLFKPKYFMPVHGEYRMLKKHAELAEGLGMQKENIFVCMNGDILELDEKEGIKKDKTNTTPVLVDQSGLGEVKNDVLRDRERMSKHGVAVLSIKKDLSAKLIFKGVLTKYDRKTLNYKTNIKVKEIFDNNKNMGVIKKQLYKEIGELLEKYLKRSPLIVLNID